MPARLGRYAVRRRIGSGGFATVWLAYDEQLDSPVAIKVLAENWTEDCHVRQRFLEEGRYLRKVESPHVVTVYDAGSLEDDRPYLVMSYADQGTLADRLEAEGLTVAAGHARWSGRSARGCTPSTSAACSIATSSRPTCCSAPSTPSTRAPSSGPWSATSGLGKALDVSSRLTMIAGTPSFVAPEQAQGEHLDARADQYSLAALTFLMLSGRPPYSHSSLSAAAAPPPPPPLSTPERPFPQAVDDVVRRGLAADRDDRFPDVPAFVAALAEALGRVRDGIAPRPLAPGRPRAHPARQPAVAGALRRRPARTGPAEAPPLVAGGGAGTGAAGGGRPWAGTRAWQHAHATRTFTDDDRTLRSRCRRRGPATSRSRTGCRRRRRSASRPCRWATRPTGAHRARACSWV